MTANWSGLLLCKLQNDSTDNRDQDDYAHKHEYPVFPCFTTDFLQSAIGDGCHLNLPTLPVPQFLQIISGDAKSALIHIKTGCEEWAVVEAIVVNERYCIQADEQARNSEWRPLYQPISQKLLVQPVKVRDRAADSTPRAVTLSAHEHTISSPPRFWWD